VNNQTTTAGHSPCQKCSLPPGSIVYYVGGIRLCGLCYSEHRAKIAAPTQIKDVPHG
jgi:hypothetical protein